MATTSKKIHSLLGLILLLPLIAWILTGAVFLIKPGYEGAYEKLAPKTYSIENPFLLNRSADWQEVRYLKTTLGYHLLVRTDNGWQHLDPLTNKPFPKPDQTELKKLIQDALSDNLSRYGQILSYQNDVFKTNTGVELKIDWDTLSITQKGVDTKVIGRLYKIHYLQWFGHDGINKVFGVTGLATLLMLVFYGLVSYFRKPVKQSDN